ncbi:3-dehydroquinate synthase [Bacteroidia bacterium]|nr:3-dehydroquinate synthase [Bacteroidia bacterium]
MINEGMENIIFTSAVAEELQRLLKDVARKNVFVLTDTNTFKYCLPLLEGVGIEKDNVFVIPQGEASKSLQTAEQIWLFLLERVARRDSLLINLGGGVVSDLGGFTASTFKRGIKYVNVPTTLLSQVDASVGGKTGINLGGLKNNIGTFSIPQKVIIDTVFLKTLPECQLLSGFAEMLKHALLSGEDSLNKILNTEPTDIKALASILPESVAVKYRIVEADPFEAGIRKALNLGHTFGHALESASMETNTPLLHGEAVAYGLFFALSLSVKKKGFSEELFHKIHYYIYEHYCKMDINGVDTIHSLLEDTEHLYRLMLQDKKNDGDGVKFVLLTKPGEYSVDNQCSKEEIEQAVLEWRKMYHEG